MSNHDELLRRQYRHNTDDFKVVKHENGRYEFVSTKPTYEELEKELTKLKECTMGVGAGDGKLFVHGDYESVKAAQDIVLERDRLKGEVEKISTECKAHRQDKEWLDIAIFCRAELPEEAMVSGFVTSLLSEFDRLKEELAEERATQPAFVNGIVVEKTYYDTINKKAELWDKAKEMGKTFGVALPEWFLEQVEAALKAGKESK